MPVINFSERVERITEHLRIVIDTAKKYPGSMELTEDWNEQILTPLYDDLQAALLDEPTRFDKAYPAEGDPLPSILTEHAPPG